MKLGEWVETELYGEEVTHVAYRSHKESEVVMDSGKILTTLEVNFRLADGTETGWIQPPETKMEPVKEGYLFGEIL
ncbi:hypothetical protein NVP1101O_069 [Vibrio phage 1.101.O._10N.261.45.C6]|nr:hypothetical protein NVP1101O_069 [Vibrio phage 1.101.O._10N.261.45.C6]